MVIPQSSYLESTEDAIIAKAFFCKAFRNKGITQKVNIDKSDSNTCALDDFNKSLPEEQKIEIR